MFDQRELIPPVERTFQNQRPGSSVTRARTPLTCNVCMALVKRRSRAMRRS